MKQLSVSSQGQVLGAFGHVCLPSSFGDGYLELGVIGSDRLVDSSVAQNQQVLTCCCFDLGNNLEKAKV